MSILMCGALGALLGLKKLRTQTAAAMLSILGLTLFEQLFEARARYLYSYTPVYILLAAVGLVGVQNPPDRPGSGSDTGGRTGAIGRKRSGKTMCASKILKNAK